MNTNNFNIEEKIKNNIFKLKNQAITLFIKREELEQRISDENFYNLDNEIAYYKQQLEKLKDMILSKDKNIALNREQLMLEYDKCCENIDNLNLKKFRQEQNQRLLKRIAQNKALENKLNKKIQANIRTLKKLHNLSSINDICTKAKIKEVI